MCCKIITTEVNKKPSDTRCGMDTLDLKLVCIHIAVKYAVVGEKLAGDPAQRLQTGAMNDQDLHVIFVECCYFSGIRSFDGSHLSSHRTPVSSLLDCLL